MNKKINAAMSIGWYIGGVLCLLMMAKVGMLAVESVRAAIATPDYLFTNKFLYVNILLLIMEAGVMWIATLGFNKCFQLGLFYWKLAFGGKDED